MFKSRLSLGLNCMLMTENALFYSLFLKLLDKYHLKLSDKRYIIINKMADVHIAYYWKVWIFFCHEIYLPWFESQYTYDRLLKYDQS